MLFREVEFTLVSEPNLGELAVMQRLQVNAGMATVQLAYGGKLVVDTADLTAQVFKVPISSNCQMPHCPSLANAGHAPSWMVYDVDCLTPIVHLAMSCGDLALCICAVP